MKLSALHMGFDNIESLIIHQFLQDHIEESGQREQIRNFLILSFLRVLKKGYPMKNIDVLL